MKETIGRINNLFNNEQLSGRLLKSRAGQFEKLFRDMIIDIKSIEVDEFSASVTKVINARAICDVIKNRVLFERNTSDELSFMADFILVIFNWNNNTFMDEGLKTEAGAVTNFINGQFTMRETMEVMKAMNERMVTLQNWNPPAFKISQSLFNALK